MCIEVDETLFDGSSEYQSISIFKTRTYGKMMTIDGCIQSTERDEFSYHEMMAHVPLFCHPDPKDVCIIGGGDGGVLREVLRHDCVKSGAARVARTCALHAVCSWLEQAALAQPNFILVQQPP